MKAYSRNGRRGFTLVELLAVVLVLAVLAAVAVPLYLNTRKSSAARTCKGNLAAIAAAQSAYATRFGAYVADNGTNLASETLYTAATVAGGSPTGGLVGAPEGLAQPVKCPLDGDSYTCTVASGVLTITCPNQSNHQADTGTSASWVLTLRPAGNDTTNPL